MAKSDIIRLEVEPGLALRERTHRVCAAAIRARYGTLYAFAKEVGISRGAVSNVIGCTGHSEWLENTIADLVGEPASALFPPPRQRNPWKRKRFAA
jgi:hypothetical protein